MKLLLIHGWGFDSSVWRDFAPHFPGAVLYDRGYFGNPAETFPDDPFVAVTHSFGTMLLLARLPRQCRGIVALAGFDRFSAATDFPGVPARIVGRMLERFGQEPDRVLAEFRKRCGSDEAFGELDTARLANDLAMLHGGDFRDQAARSAIPILSIQGGADPILPPAMREAVFTGAPDIERYTLLPEAGPEAGHLLPLTDAAPCAHAVSRFMERAS